MWAIFIHYNKIKIVFLFLTSYGLDFFFLTQSRKHWLICIVDMTVLILEVLEFES